VVEHRHFAGWIDRRDLRFGVCLIEEDRLAFELRAGLCER
jgi:hypothetical protein